MNLQDFIRRYENEIINVSFLRNATNYKVLGIPVTNADSSINIMGIFYVPRNEIAKKMDTFEKVQEFKQIGTLSIPQAGNIDFSQLIKTKTETLTQIKFFKFIPAGEAVASNNYNVKVDGWKINKFIHVLPWVQSRYPAIYNWTHDDAKEWNYSTHEIDYNPHWTAKLNIGNNRLTIDNGDEHLSVGGEFWIEYTKEIKVVE